MYKIKVSDDCIVEVLGLEAEKEVVEMSKTIYGHYGDDASKKEVRSFDYMTEKWRRYCTTPGILIFGLRYLPENKLVALQMFQYMDGGETRFDQALRTHHAYRGRGFTPLLFKGSEQLARAFEASYMPKLRRYRAAKRVSLDSLRQPSALVRDNGKITNTQGILLLPWNEQVCHAIARLQRERNKEKRRKYFIKEAGPKDTLKWMEDHDKELFTVNWISHQATEENYYMLKSGGETNWMVWWYFIEDEEGNQSLLTVQLQRRTVGPGLELVYNGKDPNAILFALNHFIVLGNARHTFTVDILLGNESPYNIWCFYPIELGFSHFQDLIPFSPWKELFAALFVEFPLLTPPQAKL